MESRQGAVPVTETAFLLLDGALLLAVRGVWAYPTGTYLVLRSIRLWVR